MTDSKNKINYDINTQAGISNLIDIYSGFTLKTPSEIIDLYKNKMYGHLKIDLAEILIENIRPIREKTFEILNDKTYLNKVLLDGAKNASEIASETYKKIKNEFGV
jgi:tryptophanyl-tRNA synthetase